METSLPYLCENQSTLLRKESSSFQSSTTGSLEEMESYQECMEWEEEENFRYDAFVKAAMWGDVIMVKVMLLLHLVEVGDNNNINNNNHAVVDVDGPSHWCQKNALYQVSEQGNVTMVQTLLQLGANVHIQCKNYSQWGEMVLHAACYHCRSIEVVETPECGSQHQCGQ